MACDIIRLCVVMFAQSFTYAKPKLKRARISSQGQSHEVVCPSIWWVICWGVNRLTRISYEIVVATTCVCVCVCVCVYGLYMYAYVWICTHVCPSGQVCQLPLSAQFFAYFGAVCRLWGDRVLLLVLREQEPVHYHLINEQVIDNSSTAHRSVAVHGMSWHLGIAMRG